MNIKQKLAAGFGAAALLSGSAMAALPDGVTTAIEAYKTDGLAALGLILGAGVAIWGLKRLGLKMGWF